MNRIWKLLAGTTCGLVLACGYFVGCDTTEDDSGSAVVGIWQHTEMAGGDTLAQETSQIKADGTWTTVTADYEQENCYSASGTYTADEDSIHSVYNTEAWDMAYTHSGDTLVITDPDGSTTTFTRISAMVGCDDYNFGNVSQWSGTIAAIVGGTPMEFNSFIFGGIEQGILVFGGNANNRQLQITLLSSQAGTYTLGTGSMAAYVPNTNNPNDLFMTVATIAEGSITLDASTATHIVGTFSFTGFNPTNQQTIQVTGGVVDITLP